MRVRSLYIVDFGDMVRTVNMSVLAFMNEYGITSTTDLTNLFCARMILRMADVYAEVHDAFIAFYLKREEREELTKATDIVKYSKFLNLIEKKIAMPVFYGHLPYHLYVKMLERDCPEYDEIMATHTSFADFLPRLAEQARRLKYRQIDREVVNDTRNLLKRLTSL